MSNVSLRYTGVGFILGVPSRDLSADEVALYQAQIEAQQALTGMKMYVPVTPPAPAPEAIQPEQPAPKRKGQDETSAKSAEGGN